MSLNVTFDGYGYLNDGTTLAAGNVAYQAYFHKVNGGSSPSKWNAVRVTESGSGTDGYYSLNLGDGDFLTQDGSAGSGDIVVIVFWKPTTASRIGNCPPLVEWGLFRVVLGTGPGMTSDAVYTNDVQVKYNICPNLYWDLPLSGYVGTPIAATNTSTDTHQWGFDGAKSAGSVTMYQRNSWYTTLMGANAVNNTDYDWDDGNQDIDLPGAANGSHQWSAPGNYTVEIVIEDECGCTVTGTKSIQILNNAPTCGITRCQSDGTPITGNTIPIPDTPVYFKYDGVDANNTITSIDWIINDSGAYGTTNTISGSATVSKVVSHTTGSGTDWLCDNHYATPGAFTNPGAHDVEAIIYWWDGFTTQTGIGAPCEETFIQEKFTDLYADFSQQNNATISGNIDFVNTTTSGAGEFPPCESYIWKVYDENNNEVPALTVSGVDHSHVFTISGSNYDYDYDVELCAYWHDGWEPKDDCVRKDIIYSTAVEISEVECYYNLHIYGTSSDGSVSGYHWEVYKYTTFSGGESECDTYSDSTELLWTSPTGMDQQDKKVCFTALGCYKLVGYVHGTGATTSDYENLHIDEVCEPTASGVEIVAICPPEFDAHEFGKKGQQGKEIDPSMRTRYDDLRASMRARYFDDLTPEMKGKERKPIMQGTRRRTCCPFYEDHL